MKTLLTVVLICLMPLAASARIGETLEQCIARYGQPVATNKEEGTVIFDQEGRLFQCTFDITKCIGVSVTPKGNKAMSSRELSQLMADNAGGGTWKPGKTNKTIRMWTHESGLTAYYESSERVLIIEDPKQIELANVEREKKAKADAAAIFAAAKLPAALTTVKGKSFTGVTLKAIDPDGIRIVHDQGIAKILLEEIPEDLRAQFHFNTRKAMAFRETMASAQQEEMQKRLAMNQDENHRREMENQGRAGEKFIVSSYSGAEPFPTTTPFSLKDIKAVQKDFDGKVVPILITSNSATSAEQQKDGSFVVYTEDGFVTFPHEASAHALTFTPESGQAGFYALIRFGQNPLIVGTNYDARKKTYTWRQ